MKSLHQKVRQSKFNYYLCISLSDYKLNIEASEYAVKNKGL
jgi:hypothetical protein